ncbi:MAG: hypothetical protein KBS53_01070, partial [Bacteroidales bacterium]|nr:hypothetical protein [Candidatus Hennigimonas equi]
RIYVSLFSHFPAVSANVENLSITYPASRFDSTAGDRIDTLASFRRFTAAVNVLSLLRGTINVKTLELVRPRAFICNYDDSTTNLSVFKFSLNEETDVAEDTSVTVLPRILLRNVRLGDRARIIYTDKPSDLRAVMLLRNFSVNGRLASYAPLDGRFRLNLDTLLVMGRLRGDTLLFDLDHFALRYRRQEAELDAEAKAYAATRSFGRIKVPFSLGGIVNVAHSDSLWNISCSDLDMNVATVGVHADAVVEMGDSIAVRGSISVPDADIQTLLDEYVVHFYPYVSRIRTTAKLSAGADVEGCFYPYSDDASELNLKAGIAYNGEGLHLNAAGSGRNVLSDNGSVSLDASLAMSLDTLGVYLSDMTDVRMKGSLDADICGSLPLSGISIYNLRNTDLKADAVLKDVALSTADDSLSLSLGDMDVRVALMEDRFKISNRKGVKALGAIVKMDSLNFRYCDSLSVIVRDMGILAQTSPVRNTAAGGKKYNPLSVSLSLGKVSVKGIDSLSLRLTDSKSRASVVPSAEDRNLPRISLSSNNRRLSARRGPHRFFLSGLNFTADTRLNQAGRRGSSTRGRALAAKSAAVPAAERDSAFNLSILRNYLARWSINGGLDLERLVVATPAFPLRTSATKFCGSFDNESVRLDSLRLRAGASRLDVDGSISDIRRALYGRGDIKLALNLDSDTLAVSELLNAFAIGQSNMKTDLSYLAEADDEQYERMVAETGADSISTVQPSLIKVPSRIDAAVRLRGRRVSFSSLNVDSLSADLAIRKRCLQLKDMAVHTPVGGIFADAFYSTQTGHDVYAGFDFTLVNVSAGETIKLIPQIDTLMPLLKTFDGLLNCTVSATSQLDTNMNLIMPSLEGVVRISGEDLHFNDNEEITRLARMLWIKNPGRATIDSMRVEGILRDNTLEIFPFLIKMDKWNLAVAGIQNMDKSFSYHVSLVKTPLLVKLGANITGPDFDHMSFKLGKAKYRSDNLPSFSREIDQSRTNLVESIQNVFKRSVHQAVMDNRSQRHRFQQARDRAGYRRSVSLEALEELSGSDRRQLDSLSTGTSDIPDTLKTVPVTNGTDSLKTASVVENAVDLQ